MPIYLWIEQKSGKQVEIIRSFDDYEIPPTKEECSDVPEDPEWKRSIGDKITLTRGPNWGYGSKGNW